MKRQKLYYLIISLLLAQYFFGQRDCSENDLIGRWSLVSFYNREFKNVDSLKKETQNDEISKIFSVFNTDNTYYGTENSMLGSYFLDSLNCMIIIKTNNKGKELVQRMNIVYVDTTVLILKHKTDNSVLTFGFRKIIPDTNCCNPKEILGEWNLVTMFNTGEAKIDSVKRLPKDFPKIKAVWTFNTNGQHFSDINEVKENGTYSFDSGICEVKLKAGKRTVDYQIYFMDSKHLILREKFGKNFYRYIYFMR